MVKIWLVFKIGIFKKYLKYIYFLPSSYLVLQYFFNVYLLFNYFLIAILYLNTFENIYVNLRI